MVSAEFKILLQGTSCLKLYDANKNVGILDHLPIMVCTMHFTNPDKRVQDMTLCGHNP